MQFVCSLVDTLSAYVASNFAFRKSWVSREPMLFCERTKLSLHVIGPNIPMVLMKERTFAVRRKMQTVTGVLMNINLQLLVDI